MNGHLNYFLIVKSVVINKLINLRTYDVYV